MPGAGFLACPPGREIRASEREGTGVTEAIAASLAVVVKKRRARARPSQPGQRGGALKHFHCDWREHEQNHVCTTTDGKFMRESSHRPHALMVDVDVDSALAMR